MAKEDLSVKIGASFVGKAAFRQAEKSITKLGKQAASLALGGGLLAFGRSSVQAFYESEKSAKALYGTLNNLGLAFKKDDVNNYVDSLSRATGIVDETLNPALQVLLLNTRDLTKSQQLLGTALDISAGTGQNLQSVAEALSKAYNGNRTALGKLNLGLTKGELAAKDFDDVLRVLNYNFEGQASAAATGFTGDVDKMRVAIDQFKEAIGQGFAKSLQDSTGNIDGTTTAFVNLGKAIGKLIELNAKVSPLQIFSKDFWRNLAGDPSLQSKMSAGFTYSLGSGAETEIAASKQRRLEAARLKIEQQQLAAQKAALRIQQNQAKLKKSQGILDLQQIEILAALQNKLSEDEKKRLALQYALLTENGAEANRLSNELAISQLQTTQLASAIANLPKALNPFADYPFYVQQAAAQLASMGQMFSPTAGNLSNPFVGQYAANYGAYAESPFTPYSGNPNPINYNITVNGVVGSPSDVTDVIRQELLNQSNTGSNTFVNTLKGIS